MKNAIYTWLASLISSNGWLLRLVLRFGWARPYKHIKHFDGKPYMNRWWLMPKWMFVLDKDGYPEPPEWFFFRIRLHHIITEDYDRDLHDHPADYRTLIISGWYIERDIYGVERVFSAGSSREARAENFHRIIKVSPGGVWTIFIMKQKRNEWGFFKGDRKIPWREYFGRQNENQL